MSGGFAISTSLIGGLFGELAENLLVALGMRLFG
jgi:hypothetical protein